MDRNVANVAAAVLALIGLAVGAPWLARELRSLPSASHLAARSDQRIVTLEVRGLAGPGDSDAVSAALRSTPGVTAWDVRPAQARIYVVVGRAVADSAVLAAIRGASSAYAAEVVPR